MCWRVHYFLQSAFFFTDPLNRALPTIQHTLFCSLQAILVPLMSSLAQIYLSPRLDHSQLGFTWLGIRPPFLSFPIALTAKPLFDPPISG